MIATPTCELFVPTLAAIGPREFISIMFVVIAFISWIWSVINGNQNQGPVARRMPPEAGRQPTEKDLQAEINRFLREVTGQQTDEVEVIDAEEAEVRPRRKRSKKSQRESVAAAQSRSVPDADRASRRPGGQISQRKGPGSTDLGSGVREHLAEHMQDRMVKQAQEHLGHAVADKVQKDLGTFTPGIAPAEQRTSTAAVIAKVAASATSDGVNAVIRDHATLKQAFVMNLILTRPNFRKGAVPYRR